MESYPTVDSTGKRIPNPSMPLSISLAANVVEFTSDFGNVQRRQRGAMKRTFELTYTVLTPNQLKAIRDFFIARKGTVESFYWTDPNEKVRYTVRFANKELVAKNIAHNSAMALYSLELKLEEVL